jgi:streptomycin 6-kinase
MTEDRLKEKKLSARLHWRLTDEILIAETDTSCVFKANRPQGQVVLKILKDYGADEIFGANLMRWYGGDGAAEIYDIHKDMILMEWLNGDSAGDLVRDGHDEQATEVLFEVARKLHKSRAAEPTDLQPLSTRFNTLVRSHSDWWPVSHRAQFAQATAIAQNMLESTETAIPLHGDFHHDNVVGSSRDWLAIDPKGFLATRHTSSRTRSAIRSAPPILLYVPSVSIALQGDLHRQSDASQSACFPGLSPIRQSLPAGTALPEIPSIGI